MTAPRSVIVSIQSAVAHHSAMEAGIEFAALFRAPVRGLYVENAALPDLGDLPAAFHPIGFGRTGDRSVRQAMTTALMRETRRVRAEMERYAARARVEMTLTVDRGALSESLAKTTATGDIVVTSVDFSEPKLSSAVHAAARLCPASGGVLIVPERRPSRSGIVVVIVDKAEDQAATIAARVAAGLGVPLLIFFPEPAESLRQDLQHRLTPDVISPDQLQFRTIADQSLLDVSSVGSAAVRLIVCTEPLLARMSLDGADAPMRHFRAPLLLLVPEHAKT